MAPPISKCCLDSCVADVLQVLHFAAVVTHNQDTAFMLAIAFTAVNILLSNYFIPFSQVEFDWIAWLQYLSAMAYTFEGLVQLEFSDRTFDCSQGRDVRINGDQISRITGLLGDLRA